MFHKIKEVHLLSDKRLIVLFVEGVTKIYDIAPLIAHFEAFKALEDADFYERAKVDVGGYGVVWDDDVDLSCDELWENGVIEKTPFDGLMSFADATELWGLSESTLRKAVSHGKIISGVDARKYGKQWIITKDAMLREYGKPIAM